MRTRYTRISTKERGSVISQVRSAILSLRRNFKPVTSPDPSRLDRLIMAIISDTHCKDYMVSYCMDASGVLTHVFKTSRDDYVLIKVKNNIVISYLSVTVYSDFETQDLVIKADIKITHDSATIETVSVDSDEALVVSPIAPSPTVRQ